MVRRAYHCLDLIQKLLYLGFQTLDFVVDLVEWSGWGVGVEVAGEGDFVADFGFVGVVPGVGDVGVDFFLEVVVDCVFWYWGVVESSAWCLFRG